MGELELEYVYDGVVHVNRLTASGRFIRRVAVGDPILQHCPVKAVVRVLEIKEIRYVFKL